jgi:hypothetical protein
MRALSMTTIGALLCLSAPAQAELVVNISKSEQRLAVVVDGTELYRWPVSTGRPGYPTPAGAFRPTRLEPNWHSHQYNMTPMPWSVFFYRGYALHGTMEANNLGRAVSHGCVRLRPENASVLFALIRRSGVNNIKLVVTDGPLPRARRLPSGTPMAAAEPQAPRAAMKDKTEKVKIEKSEKAGKSEKEKTEKVKAEPAKIAEKKIEKREMQKAENVKPAPKPLPTDTAKHLSAKTHLMARARSDEERDTPPPIMSRLAGVEAYRISIGSDEARILREREAWLRAIDLKYGITH